MTVESKPANVLEVKGVGSKFNVDNALRNRLFETYKLNTFNF